MTPSQVLRKAAEVIEEFGWIQGEYGGADEGYCVDGAIQCAAHGAYDRFLARSLLCGYLRASWLPLWNDAPERTKDQVIAALRAAAERPEAGERR
jgi:hypothetical protein